MATLPYTAQSSYGGSAVSNRVMPKGTLGTNQYYYTTNAKSGKITVNRYVPADGTGVEVAFIRQGNNTIVVNSNTTSAETSFFSTPSNIANVRKQALQVASKEWDGRTQPPPTQAIYGGAGSGVQAFDPAGSVNQSNSVKNTQTAAAGSDDTTNPYGTGDGAVSSIANTPENKKINGFSGGIKSGLGGNYVAVYPSSIAASGQDYIKIEALEYQGKAREGLGWGDRATKNRNSKGTVVLPIPGGISDSNSVSWGGDKMGPMDTALANIALSGIEKGASGALAEVESLGRAASGGGGTDMEEALKTGIAGMASGTGSQLLTRTTGKILNPNMELLFKDPSLRPFSFGWKLAPRSAEEAQQVIKLIRFFKSGMAPSKSKSNLFLESPYTWKIAYKHKGKTHKYLNRFKECAINSFTVQYTPDGNYATFEDGVMTAYQITMTLTELEPIFRNDYDELGDNYGIGY
tara:strand:- start:980 stop:2365 length:1386 start_codon:yes stop_codon:yes gene_type:complete